MNRKWIIMLSVLILAAAILLVCLIPSSAKAKAAVTVTFLAVTNDVTGAKFALFSASNSTERLFVRGRSEIEVHGTLSNQLTVVQITNVDYLNAGQSVTFLIPYRADGEQWRLKFYYIGQFSRLESIKHDLGWFLQQHGIPVPEDRLPSRAVRELTTEWIAE